MFSSVLRFTGNGRVYLHFLWKHCMKLCNNFNFNPLQMEDGEQGVKITVEEEKGGRLVTETIQADKKPLRYV